MGASLVAKLEPGSAAQSGVAPRDFLTVDDQGPARLPARPYFRSLLRN